MSLINRKLNLDKFLLVIFSFYPLVILIGNFSINLFILTVGSLFFYKFIKKKENFNIDKKIFFLLIFFFISLCVNLFFTNNFNLSYQRVTKFIFVIFFVLAFSFLIKNYFQNLENIFKIWSLIFLIVIIDLLIEFFLGKNILGQNSIMPGRLASFTGEESVIGSFFLGFCLIFLSYIYEKKKRY